MPTIDPRLILVFVWIVVCTVVTLWLLWHRRPIADWGAGPLLLLALLVRLLPALILPRGASYEMGMFQRAATAVRTGQNLYLADIAYPYLPLQLYWFAAADWMAEQAGLFFIFWLKSGSILADIGLVFLVYHAVQKTRGENEARLAGWVYALNPVTILVAAYQGQFDAIPLFFLVLAWYLWYFYGQKRAGLVLSALALGMAILSKTWPVIFLLILILRLPDWRRRFMYASLAAIFPLLGIVFYEWIFPGSLTPILTRAVRAGAIPGWWGYSAVANVFVELTGRGGAFYQWLGVNGKLAGLAAGLLTILLTRKWPALASLLLTILVLFAAVPNLGLQGLSWLIPLAVIAGAWDELGWYIIGVTFHMLVSYWGVHLTEGLFLLLPHRWASIVIQLSSLSAWLVVVLWCLQTVLPRRFLPAFSTVERPPVRTAV